MSTHTDITAPSTAPAAGPSTTPRTLGRICAGVGVPLLVLYAVGMVVTYGDVVDAPDDPQGGIGALVLMMMAVWWVLIAAATLTGVLGGRSGRLVPAVIGTSLLGVLAVPPLIGSIQVLLESLVG
ncbi:hypothetical protein [Nocardioides yefusunii]|uniref:Uncharacterized protein n=1 Tax=Nocardioides yefusunii TaxID=2500546 RepID=A0ABW1R1Z7_9ACTN|nr:hypothetical protein [Nocardioides yefusunii]